MTIDSDLWVIIRHTGKPLLRKRADFVRLCAGLFIIYWGYFGVIVLYLLVYFDY